MFFLTKLFYLPKKKKTWVSDIGVKTCYIREAEKQRDDLPFWPETQQRSHLSTHSKLKIPLIPKSLPTPSCVFPCVSICSPGCSVLSMANSCPLATASTPWPKVHFNNTVSYFYSMIKYPGNSLVHGWSLKGHLFSGPCQHLPLLLPIVERSFSN